MIVRIAADGDCEGRKTGKSGRGEGWKIGRVEEGKVGTREGEAVGSGEERKMGRVEGGKDGRGDNERTGRRAADGSGVCFGKEWAREQNPYRSRYSLL